MEAHRALKIGEPPPPKLKISEKQGIAQLEIDHPDGAFGQLSLLRALGTTSYDFLNGTVRQLAELATLEQKVDQDTLNFILSIINGIRPTDETEAMLATQMAAAHVATMTLARRLACVGSIEQQDSAERAFNKLARTFAMQLETLKRYRTGGQQQVRVEHVHVHAGGQAVVGVVESPGGGEQQKSKDQPHAHAPQSSMWGEDKKREPVPVTGDAERPVSHARRNVSRSTQE
jgi:hypothetical protein